MKPLPNPKKASGIALGISIFAASFASSSLMANSCSKADIDYYLQRGFTHEQVIRLCADSPMASSQGSLSQGSAAQGVAASTISPNSQYALPGSGATQNMALTEDRVYFETVLNAQSANLTPNSLSYTANECVEYGDVNLVGLRDKACVNSHVTVNFKGLKIIKAVKGIMLIRDQEMILQGNINREYLNFNSLKPGQQAVIRAQLPTKPNRLDLPVRKGIDPKQVATKLKKYITP